MSDERRRALHGRVADALAPTIDEPGAAGVIGEHLLRAGRAAEAAPLLYRAGRELYERQSLRDALPVLEAALEAFGDDDEREGTRGEIRQLVIVSGAMADRDIVLRQGESALDLSWRQAGLDVAERVAPWLGRPLALASAVLTATMRRLWSRRARNGAPPLEAMRSALMISGACFAAYAQLRDFSRMDALLARLGVFDTFRSTVPHTGYRLSRAMLHIVSGNHRSCRVDCTAALSALASDRMTPLSGYDRLVAEATIRNARAWVSVVDQDRRFEEDIETIEGMDLPSFAFSCAIYRAVFHRLRGEESEALQMEERAERIRVRLGSLWMWEGLLWQQSSLAYAFTRDVLGLKRCLDELQRMEQQGYFLADYIELTMANYRREHGEHVRARKSLEDLARSLPERTVLVQHVLASLGETALAQDDRTRVREVLARCRALAEDEDKGLQSMRARLARLEALTDAADGLHARAFDVLDKSIAEAEALGSPSLAGALHEAGVAVALGGKNAMRIMRHREGAERWFRSTGTPALIARLEQLRAMCERRASGSSLVVADVLTTLERPGLRSEI